MGKFEFEFEDKTVVYTHEVQGAMEFSFTDSTLALSSPVDLSGFVDKTVVYNFDIC